METKTIRLTEDLKKKISVIMVDIDPDIYCKVIEVLSNEGEE